VLTTRTEFPIGIQATKTALCRNAKVQKRASRTHFRRPPKGAEVVDPPDVTSTSTWAGSSDSTALPPFVKVAIRSKSNQNLAFVKFSGL